MDSEDESQRRPEEERTPNKYHKSLIDYCDTFTGIQHSLLTRFAISGLFVLSVRNCDCESSVELRSTRILAMLFTDIIIVKLKTISLITAQYHSIYN